MEHRITLNAKYFDFVENGTKRIEPSLFHEKRKNIKLGDDIIFVKEPDYEKFVKAKVINIYTYPNFEEMFKHFDISELADSSMTKEELIKELEQYYTKSKQLEYGVIGIQFKLI